MGKLFGKSGHFAKFFTLVMNSEL